MSWKFLFFMVGDHIVISANACRKGGDADSKCHFCMKLLETTKHCLWSYDFAMKKCKRIVTLLILVYPRAMLRGVVLRAVVQGQPILYKQDDPTDVLFMRHSLMQKKLLYP